MKTIPAKTTLLHKVFLIASGIIVSLLITEIALRTAEVACVTVRTIKNRRTFLARGNVRILCLGESTTSGGYPGSLEKYLTLEHPELKYSVFDEGRPAMTTRDILANLEKNLDRYRPDIVVTMMGINDGNDLGPAMHDMISRGNDGRNSLKTFKLIRWLCWNIVSHFAKDRHPKHLPLATADTDQTSCYEAVITPADKNLYRQWLNLHIRARNAEAEMLLRKNIAEEPNNGLAYGLLIWTLYDLEKYTDAKGVFETASQRRLRHYLIDYRWGILCRKTGRHEESERAFRNAISLWPQNDSPYIEIFTTYYLSKKYEAAEGILAEAAAAKLNSARIQGALSLVRAAMGKPQEHTQLRWVLSPQVAQNYRDLRHELNLRGIRYVCVQYPMREVSILKNLFPENSGIVYVDNEWLFREAVRRDGTATYFKDLFAGDFGHCTAKGNELLAENIAKVIARDILR